MKPKNNNENQLVSLGSGDSGETPGKGDCGPWTTGDLAKMTQSTVRTVRFYEEAGLISPCERSDGGHRVYRKEELSRLELVLDLREIGLSLQEIKALFELKADSKNQVDASRQICERLQARVDELQEKITKLRKLRSELVATIGILAECSGCTTKSFPQSCSGCDVIEGEDMPRAVRLLWS